MKIISKILLTVLFILFFLIWAVSGTFKFQLLQTDFWETTFQTTGSYSTLSTRVVNTLERGVIDKGGNKNDVAVFTDLATSSNLKDLINENIENFFSYMYGQSTEAAIYIPLNRIPKSFIPISLNGASQQMTLSELSIRTGISSVSQEEIKSIQILPQIINAIFFLSLIFMTLIIFGLYKLTESGKKFGSIGLSFTLSGGLVFVIAKIFDILGQSLNQGLINKTNMAHVIIGTMTPPILDAVSKIWVIEGVLMMVLGLILFFIKKPYNTVNQK